MNDESLVESYVLFHPLVLTESGLGGGGSGCR
jgi:hypothetical protein